MTSPTETRDPALIQFGTTLRTAREMAGKNQRTYAAEVGISEYHLRAIEAGRDRASNSMYWRICRPLGVDPTSVLKDGAA